MCIYAKRWSGESNITTSKELENEQNIKVHFMMMEEGIEYDLPKSITPIILSNSKKVEFKSF